MNKMSIAEEEKQSWACSDNCVCREQINNVVKGENRNILTQKYNIYEYFNKLDFY